MKYQIEQWPAFRVAGISHRIKTDRAFELVPQIWAKAWKDGTMKKFMSFFPDYRPSGFLGIAAGAESGCSDEMDYIQAVTNYVETPGCSHVPAPEGMAEFSYLAGVECNEEAQAPYGWTKWIIPSYEYIYVEKESNDSFSNVIEYLQQNEIMLVGAVHDFNCPKTGKGYMFFPIRAL